MIYTLTLNPSIDYLVRLDKVKFGELNRMQEEKFLAGGKGINVSRILNQLSYKTTSFGFIGGFTGEFIKKELKNEGIITDFIEIENPTRINIKLKTKEETEINSHGPTIDKSSADLLLAKISELQSNDLLVVSGSKAKNLPEDYYQKIIDRVKKADAEFIIDTTGEELMDALAARPLLVKPNGIELAELYDVTLESEADYIQYGKKLIKEGAKFAIVSLGGEGALFFSRDQIYRGISPKGLVKNTVGAGDSMVAAFAGKYLESSDELEAFKLALASGSATAFTEDLAKKEEIDKLLSEVKVIKI
ncbi:MAG: 1-phosphofructokinase [Atopostipes suicloacalis]|nr:1-phosphofructokinase [Atopostipes suicloacalis]